MARKKPGEWKNTKLVTNNTWNENESPTSDIVDDSSNIVFSVVNEPEKIFFWKMIFALKWLLFFKHWLAQNELEILKSKSKMVNDDIDKIHFPFLMWIKWKYKSRYIKTKWKYDPEIDYDIINSMIDGFSEMWEMIKEIMRLWNFTFKDLVNWKKETSEMSVFGETKNTLEVNFINWVEDLVNFIKWKFSECSLLTIDFNNFFTIENLNLFIKFYQSDELKWIVDMSVIYNIIMVMSWNIFLHWLVNWVDEDEIIKAVNKYEESWKSNDYIDSLNRNWILTIITIDFEYILKLHNTIKSFQWNEELYKNYFTNKLWVNISRATLDKFRRSWIDENLTWVSNNKREFLYKVIFSDINLFCKWWDFINQNLFWLLMSATEDRQENILKILDIWLSIEHLEFIIKNKIEALALKLSKDNLEYLIILVWLWVNIENIIELWDNELAFLKAMKLQDIEKIGYIIQIIKQHPTNYKNVILNKSLKLETLAKIQLLDSNSELCKTLKRIISRRNFEEKDNEKNVNEINSTFERYWEIIEENPISDWAISVDIASFVSELDFEEHIYRIIFRILELISDNDQQWIFIEWLNDNKNTTEENIRKILSILALFRDLNGKIDILNILINYETINIWYLRWLIDEINEKWLSLNYKWYILIYLDDLDEKKLVKNMNDLFDRQENINGNYLDNQLSKILRSNDERWINNFWKLVQEVLSKIFQRLHPTNVTTTKNNKWFWPWSWTFMDDVRQIVFWELLKKPNESYKEYLTRLQKISLEQLFKWMKIWDINWSFYLAYITTLPIYTENFSVFYFLEMFKTDVINKINWAWKTDLEWLEKYYWSVIHEETSKLKKSLNI